MYLVLFVNRTIPGTILSGESLILEGVKFVYSEKATKFYKITTLLLSTVHTDKSRVEILQNFVAFSEYTNFIESNKLHDASTLCYV